MTSATNNRVVTTGNGFRHIIDEWSQPLIVYDTSGPKFANKAWLTLVGMDLREILAVDGVDRLFSMSPVESDVTATTTRVTVSFGATSSRSIDGHVQQMPWGGQQVSMLVLSHAGETKSRLPDFSQTTAAWFWEIDSDLCYSWFSDNIETVTGYPPEYFYGRSRVDGVCAKIRESNLVDLQSEAWLAHEKTLERRESFTGFEFQLTRADNDVRWIRSSGVPFFDSTGEFCGYRGTGSDITELKLLEFSLREGESRFRHFAEVGGDFFWELDEDLVYTYISENVLEGFGKDPSYYVGKSRLRLHANAMTEDPAWAEHIRQLEHRESFKDCVLRTQREDTGGWIWVRISGSPFLSSGGKFKGYRGCTTIITEQVESQIARAHSEERFREFSEIAADWFWELDENLCFSYISERFKEVCGVSPARVIGMSADALEGFDPDPQSSSRAAELFARQEPFEDWEFNWKHPDGRLMRISCNSKPIFDPDGNCVGHRGIASDITHAHRLSTELEFRANHDVLTGLSNRTEFDRYVENALDIAVDKKVESALLYIDLDQFKIVNDSVGHQAGDELLRRVSSLIESQVRDGDIVARLGGDEFGVLLNSCEIDEALLVAEQIAEIVREFTFTWKDKAFRVSSSIGVVMIQKTSSSVVEILSRADIACYAAKDGGRDRISLYKQDDEAVRRQHNQILQAAGIRDCLVNDRFRLYKQVILPIAKDSSTVRFELLLRLLNDNDRIIAPGAIIPAAERFGLMPSIDRWVISTAFENMKFLQSLHPGCIVSINLSGNTINDVDILTFIESEMTRFDVDPVSTCFEVTETALISNLNTATETIKSIRALGSKIALDDFGSGMSSFSYLKHLPVDYLKIDGSFVKDMATDETDCAVVAAINEVAHRLGIETIAEFIENQTIVEKLQDIGVDYGQGYELGKPVPLDVVDEYIEFDTRTAVIDGLAQEGQVLSYRR